MLSVKVTDVFGNVTDGIVPVAVTLCKEEDVPADSLELIFNETDFEELVTVELFSDRELLFSGEVDEQIKELSTNPHTELVARSSAARLIDNEAYPMTLINPSSEDIFSFFAKPLGFTELRGRNKAYQGTFTVSKGTSCFAVIRRFSLAVYGTLPRAEENVLYIEGKEGSGTFDAGEIDSTFIESLRVSTLRHSRISEVRLKLKEGELYSSVVKDDDAVKRKISKVRYLNATSASSSVPADADTILANSCKNSYYATLNCKGFFAFALGKDAEGIVEDEKLYVSSVKCTLSKSGEHTRLTLKRKEK